MKKGVMLVTGLVLAGALLWFFRIDAMRANTSALQKTISFDGELTKGQSFEKEFGNNLLFRLVPNNSGWGITITNRDTQSHNSSSQTHNFQIATSTYHGTIQRIQFLSARYAQLTKNERTRPLSFVLNETDYQKVLFPLQIYYSPFSPEEAKKAMAASINELAKGSGTLTIQSIALSQEKEGAQAGIEHMIFSVELRIP